MRFIFDKNRVSGKFENNFYCISFAFARQSSNYVVATHKTVHVLRIKKIIRI